MALPNRSHILFLHVAQVAQTSVCVSYAEAAQTKVCATGLDTNAGLAPAFSQTLIGPALARPAKGRELWASWAIKSKDLLAKSKDLLAKSKDLLGESKVLEARA
jgi:LPS sulfotransferase NodH